MKIKEVVLANKQGSFCKRVAFLKDEQGDQIQICTFRTLAD
jgi:hypothetical protein